MRAAKTYLGCQVWLEPADTPERVDSLFAQAAEAGLGWARLFLMWPWIEPEPGVWHFDVFDHAFDAAATYGIRIKATLTANSGPWHIGTPSMLHSHTGFLSSAQDEPMRRYIRACVERYARHPALGQWILWNEPSGGNERTETTLQHWRTWLRTAYQHDIARLNHRWRTGYRDFDEATFPEDIPHAAHKNGVWNSYGSWLSDWAARAAWLNDELAWVHNIVREIDTTTPTCVNPTSVLTNQAAGGTDLERMGQIVDVVGASYHPAWHFTFANRVAFPALMAAGVRLQATIPSVQRVEVTEVQTGNTLNSGKRPSDATPGEIARFYLAGLASGAESVMGWCLNTRVYDFEAGDWGLLDDMDQPSARSRMLRHVHDRLAVAFEHTGDWRPLPPRAWVAIDPASQAVEWIEAMRVPPVPGRLTDDGANGAALLATSLMQCGIPATLARVSDLPNDGTSGGLIVLSHLVAWDSAVTARLLSFVDGGGTLLIDATSGRKDLDATLYRPWPGGLAERIGLRATGIETRSEGYELLLDGLPAGQWILARLAVQFDGNTEWRAWPTLRFMRDGEPCVWERSFGRGRIIVARGVLGPSLIHAPASMSATMYVLKRAGAELLHAVRPVGSHPMTFVVPVHVEHGSLTAVFAPDVLDRHGQPIHLSISGEAGLDLWSGENVAVGADQEVTLPMPDGIALLWQPLNDASL